MAQKGMGVPSYACALNVRDIIKQTSAATNFEANTVARVTPAK